MDFGKPLWPLALTSGLNASKEVNYNHTSVFVENDPIPELKILPQCAFPLVLWHSITKAQPLGTHQP